MAKSLINTFLILLLILPFPFISFSEEIYEYERMWPVLEQPWYFDYPEGVAVDSSGNVYIADANNNRIQKFTSTGQFITKWGSSGSGDGEFYYPCGIAADSRGYVYVVDRSNARIQKFTSDGKFITKWGSGGSDDGEFLNPYGVAVDMSGDVYVADIYNFRI
jgi:DNA-binding beta-propeller fold protein YncE